jgi:hypothetical protein
VFARVSINLSIDEKLIEVICDTIAKAITENFKMRQK